jgi:hypothetical protein
MLVLLACLLPGAALAQLPTSTPTPLPIDTTLPTLPTPTPGDEPESQNGLTPPTLGPALPLPSATPAPTPEITEPVTDTVKDLTGPLTGSDGEGGGSSGDTPDGGSPGVKSPGSSPADGTSSPAGGGAEKSTVPGGRPAGGLNSYGQMVGARFGTLAHRASDLAGPFAAPMALGVLALSALAVAARGPGRLRKVEDDRSELGGRTVFRL